MSADPMPDFPGPDVPRPRSKASGMVFPEAFLAYELAPGHPESPDRLRAVSERIRASGLAAHFTPILPVADPYPALAAVHSDAHIRSIRALALAGETAARAAAGAVAAVDAVCRGELRNAFCAVRPPGHHAGDGGGEEGFCYYNNVAVAALHAQRAYGLSRVCIVDWDYHHGNATEERFYADPSVLFFSTHRRQAYPGTGDPARRGEGPGLGYTINVDLGAGATDKDMLDAWDRAFLARAEAFAPELVLISAGFDSRKDDWLGDFRIGDGTFRRLTRMAMEIAGRSAGGRVVSLLEGGYNPSGLADAVEAHLETLLGD
jgi:acetoin utilization deacetylase AcuC-like enzyme